MVSTVVDSEKGGDREGRLQRPAGHLREIKVAGGSVNGQPASSGQPAGHLREIKAAGGGVKSLIPRKTIL